MFRQVDNAPGFGVARNGLIIAGGEWPPGRAASSFQYQLQLVVPFVADPVARVRQAQANLGALFTLRYVS